MIRKRPPQHLYRIRYSRPGGVEMYRYRFDPAAVQRFVDRLHTPHPHLPPVTTIVVERVELARDWQRVPLDHLDQLGLWS